MVSENEWQYYRLLVTVTTKANTMPFLLNGITQEEFFDRYLVYVQKNLEARYHAPLSMNVQPLTEEVYEMLEPLYKDHQKWSD